MEWTETCLTSPHYSTDYRQTEILREIDTQREGFEVEDGSLSRIWMLYANRRNLLIKSVKFPTLPPQFLLKEKKLEEK